ncbi:hypothetical protein TNCV_2338551 [Trichonephila clavipes]|nr:hypothetical protein TNCV_2338551 [Trichonephila clavipes]
MYTSRYIPPGISWTRVELFSVKNSAPINSEGLQTSRTVLDIHLNIIYHTTRQLGVIVKGIISFDKWIPVVVISDTRIAWWFVNYILRPVVLPFSFSFIINRLTF